MTATIQVRATPWGRWFHELIQQPKLEQYDIAEMNLRCAVDLPGMKNELVKLGIDKINEWTDRVENFTKMAQKRLRGKRRHFTEAQFYVVAMIECLQRHVGIKYNFGFMKGEYDASDSRNLFIHGVLTGFGGTCASLPMVYAAIGRRLLYPISLATSNQHCFCRWDGDESFCFEPASQGFNARTEDYYRKWPFPITPKQEQDYGHIRPQTQQEELAMLAGQRANCLMDNFHFVSAVEALAFAKQLAPSNAIYHNCYKRGFYTAQLWNELQKVRQLSKKMPIQSAIGLASLELHGDAIETFRPDAIKNVNRILNNYETRQRVTH